MEKYGKLDAEAYRMVYGSELFKLLSDANFQPAGGCSTDEDGRCKKTGVRTYRVFGSTDLKTWSEVDDGEKDKYNFFGVNVEMP